MVEDLAESDVPQEKRKNSTASSTAYVDSSNEFPIPELRRRKTIEPDSTDHTANNDGWTEKRLQAHNADQDEWLNKKSSPYQSLQAKTDVVYSNNVNHFDSPRQQSVPPSVRPGTTSPTSEGSLTTEPIDLLSSPDKIAALHGSATTEPIDLLSSPDKIAALHLTRRSQSLVAPIPKSAPVSSIIEPDGEKNWIFNRRLGRRISVEIQNKAPVQSCNDAVTNDVSQSDEHRQQAHAYTAFLTRREAAENNNSQPSEQHVKSQPNWQQRGDDLRAEYYISSVLPNIRDLAVSSRLPNVKPGMLYRSARNFAPTVDVLHSVMIGVLGIATVIDLREDDLSNCASDEAHSRELMRELYKLQQPMWGDRGLSVSPPTTNESRRQVTSGNAARRVSRTSMRPTPGDSNFTTQTTKSLNHSTVGQERNKPPALAATVEGVAVSPDKHPIHRPSAIMGRECGTAAHDRRRRKLFICNFMATEACRSRIMALVKERGTITFSKMALFRVTDKIMGSSYAPYYFCKYFVSTHDVGKSYIEMLEYCGQKIAEVLKIITVEEGPILFHCSLGKDRTGIIAALILYSLGASEQDIVDEYSLTDYTEHEQFKEYTERFIVKMSGLTEDFCYARPRYMKDALDFLKQEYGSLSRYLDGIGFNDNWRRKMRRKFLNAKLRKELVEP